MGDASYVVLSGSKFLAQFCCREILILANASNLYIIQHYQTRDNFSKLFSCEAMF